MGNTQAPPPNDFRVERAKKLFSLPEPQIEKLWLLFLSYDRDKRGIVLVQDFFEHMLQYPRTLLTDNLLSLIDTKTETSLSFGEFVELVCTFCCFEEKELLKYFFYVLDAHRVGFVQVTDLKHMLLTIHPNKGTIREALAYLQDLSVGDEQTINFERLLDFKHKYPYSFYPLFQLQTHMKQYTLGEYWWDTHNANRYELQMEIKQHEKEKAEKDKRESQKENEAVTEEIIKKRMGIKYYLMPWQRVNEHRKLTRILAIEADLDKQSRKGYNERVTPYQ